MRSYIWSDIGTEEIALDTSWLSLGRRPENLMEEIALLDENGPTGVAKELTSGDRLTVTEIK